MAPRPRQAARGFTLIELMIGLAVVGILMALALPTYLDSIRKNRRSEGIAALSRVQLTQERWRANAAAYAAPTELAASAPAGLGLPVTTDKGLYSIAITEANATSFTATATAVDGKSQANDTRCKVLGVRMTGGNISYGARTASESSVDWTDPNRCWAR